MRRQHLLAVSATLHGTKDIFEVTTHPPKIRIGALGQAHFFQNHQSLYGVLVDEPRTAIAPVPIRVPHDCEECSVATLRPHCIALECPVEGRVAVRLYLPTLRCGGVELRAIAKLAGAEIFGSAPYALPDVVPAEAKGAAVRANSCLLYTSR